MTRHQSSIEVKNAAYEQCAQIADEWRDENKAAAAKARRSISEGSQNMAEMLDGAAIECNAIAAEIRGLIVTFSEPAATHANISDCLAYVQDEGASDA